MAAADGSNIDVVEAIVVIIADRHTHDVKAAVQPRAAGDVCEVAPAIVVIKGGGWGRLSFGAMPRPITRVNEQEIGRAIVVEINKSDPASHGLGEKLLPVSAIDMRKGDSCR